MQTNVVTRDRHYIVPTLEVELARQEGPRRSDVTKNKTFIRHLANFECFNAV